MRPCTKNDVPTATENIKNPSLQRQNSHFTFMLQCLVSVVTLQWNKYEDAREGGCGGNEGKRDWQRERVRDAKYFGRRIREKRDFEDQYKFSMLKRSLIYLVCFHMRCVFSYIGSKGIRGKQHIYLVLLCIIIYDMYYHIV